MTDQEIDSRIQMLLAGWGYVSPEMLSELPEDQRHPALKSYFDRHCSDQPFIMRGDTLVAPPQGGMQNDAGSGATTTSPSGEAVLSTEPYAADVEGSIPAIKMDAAGVEDEDSVDEVAEGAVEAEAEETAPVESDEALCPQCGEPASGRNHCTNCGVALNNQPAEIEFDESQRLYHYTKDPKTLTGYLKTMLNISLIVALVSIVFDFLQLSLLGSKTLTEAQINANDFRQMVVGLIGFGLYVVTGIAFLQWIFRANKNCRGFGARDMKFSAGLAVGCYFIPFANLVMPYRAMKEIWKVSTDPANWQNEKGSFLLVGWWAMWLISGFLGQLSIRASLAANSVADLQTSTTVSIVAGVVEIVLLVIATMLVSAIYDKQELLQRELLVTDEAGQDAYYPESVMGAQQTVAMPSVAPARSAVPQTITNQLAEKTTAALAEPEAAGGAIAGPDGESSDEEEADEVAASEPENDEDAKAATSETENKEDAEAAIPEGGNDEVAEVATSETENAEARKAEAETKAQAAAAAEPDKEEDNETIAAPESNQEARTSPIHYPPSAADTTNPAIGQNAMAARPNIGGPPVFVQTFTRRCRNCGAGVAEDAQVCMSCGMRPALGRNFCNRCGAATDPNAIMCVKCGASLTAPNTGGKAGSASAMSIISMVLSLAGIINGVTAIAGFILGLLELKKIKRGESPQAGRGFALTGAIAGGIIGGLFLFFILMFIIGTLTEPPAGA